LPSVGVTLAVPVLVVFKDILVAGLEFSGGARVVSLGCQQRESA